MLNKLAEDIAYCTAYKFGELSFGMCKTAANAIIKRLRRGVLSEGARREWVTRMPEGYTRTISRKPIDSGNEAAVFSSITAGSGAGPRGESVTKVPWDSPNSNKLTGGSTNVTGWSDRDKLPMRERAMVMWEHPNLISRPLNINGRGGYTQKKLDKVYLSREMAETLKGIPEDERRRLLAEFDDLYNRAGSAAGLEGPLKLDLSAHTKGIPLGKKYTMRDVEAERTLLNIMRDPDTGKLMITDPIITHRK